jgi:hypothetical protein
VIARKVARCRRPILPSSDRVSSDADFFPEGTWPANRDLDVVQDKVGQEHPLLAADDVHDPSWSADHEGTEDFELHAGMVRRCRHAGTPSCEVPAVQPLPVAIGSQTGDGSMPSGP